ncbi:TIGR03564 family F420-dependent LLM class oxidoreductase [Pseudonocardia lacus]|uniref:TIGR03564 family F420-dependent LLM class oxidoreductase n=1 Tax=Pseudonocardia lacus TaxID=2835865 RepID=UPI001BDD4B87|nr:TIGR03564 family F420-dependent LLM class oxidoreductase [Pseudonocardia lacus]
MDIGIAVGDLRGPTTADLLVEQVTEAADLFGTVWVSQALGWDALTALTTAGRVPRVGLGTAVVPVLQRHPLVLAGQALSTQAAVGGRLRLGVGAGIGAMLGAMYGVPHDRPALRMREYLGVLRPLLRGEAVDHHGPTLTAVGAVDVPGTTPPPVLLAALGPAMLRVAGELADGAVTWMAGPRTLHEHVVPRLARAAAGRPAPRVVAGLPVCVTADADAARARIAERFAPAGQVPEYRAVLDREGVDGPGGVAVVGDEDAVLRQLHRLRDAGATEFLAAPVGTPAEQRLTVRALTDPAFRR